MEFTSQAKENMAQFILNKREEIINKFCLDDEQFSLVLHWFTKEPTLHDEDDNTPVLVIKDESKPPKKDNMEWISIRMADAIEYARQGDKKE